jgi:hypothetical protein
MSATRRVRQKLTGPFVGYLDGMFAAVHHRLDELFLEISRTRDDVAGVERAVGLEVDVLHEVVLGLERQIVELTHRIEDLEVAATPEGAERLGGGPLG